MVAVFKGDIDYMAKDKEGRTSLAFACGMVKGEGVACAVLGVLGAKFDDADHTGSWCTAIAMACRRGFLAFLRALPLRPVWSDFAKGSGVEDPEMTLLNLVVSCGVPGTSAATIDFLLGDVDRAAAYQTVDHYGWSTLVCAADNLRADLVLKILRESGPAAICASSANAGAISTFLLRAHMDASADVTSVDFAAVHRAVSTLAAWGLPGLQSYDKILELPARTKVVAPLVVDSVVAALCAEWPVPDTDEAALPAIWRGLQLQARVKGAVRERAFANVRRLMASVHAEVYAAMTFSAGDQAFPPLSLRGLPAELILVIAQIVARDLVVVIMRPPRRVEHLAEGGTLWSNLGQGRNMVYALNPAFAITAQAIEYARTAAMPSASSTLIDVHRKALRAYHWWS
jgi:hypothetical protein